MILQISGATVPQVYQEALWAMRINGVEEESRNGPVLVIPHPVMLEITWPWNRVLFDPVRDANPFFHFMEFVWMMAGSNDAEWISMFNKRMMEYADDGVLRGAYGWRWCHPTSQIKHTIDLLKIDSLTRQAVITMWYPLYDDYRANTSDRPCNTHIYFRAIENRLDMTVCNRSNDLIWGMLGSNVVHFTMLHELISRAIGYEQGIYRVFSHNLHFYTEMPRGSDILKGVAVHDPYRNNKVSAYPLLQEDENWTMLVADCKALVDGSFLVPHDFRSQWMQNVGFPIYEAYLTKEDRDYRIPDIQASDIRLACQEWSLRHKKSS